MSTCYSSVSDEKLLLRNAFASKRAIRCSCQNEKSVLFGDVVLANSIGGREPFAEK